MKLISVVIPCYNHGEYVESAIQSILDQTYQKFEIVVVNDGSTDHFTNALLDSLEKPKCRVIRTENQGLSGARNTGIASSAGDLVCCLDADDKYHSDFFNKAVEIFSKDKTSQYGVVTAWVQFFGNNDNLWKTVGHNIEGFSSYLQAVRNNIHSSSMFRRCCWQEIGGFDQTMKLGYEDWDFWLKIFSYGYQCYCVEEPLIYYRQKEESMVTLADEMRPEILKKMYSNHHDFYAEHLNPILLERDWEVQRLQFENKRLLAEVSLKNESSKNSFYQYIKSIFRNCIFRNMKRPHSSK